MSSQKQTKKPSPQQKKTENTPTNTQDVPDLSGLVDPEALKKGKQLVKKYRQKSAE